MDVFDFDSSRSYAFLLWYLRVTHTPRGRTLEGFRLLPRCVHDYVAASPAACQSVPFQYFYPAAIEALHPAPDRSYLN